MSMKSLERAILSGAREVLNNPKLKADDIMEWSTGSLKPQEGEITVRIPDPGVWIAVKKEHDKR